MPRTLPWLVQGTTSNEKQKPASAVSKRRKLASSNPELKENEARGSSATRLDAFVPPSVEFMLASDQYFIMVEDELHDIAHQFTRSLHQAEYQRLQALAASKNASSISEIQRPTNGSVVNRKKLPESTFSMKASKVTQHIGLGKEADGSSSDEEEKELMGQWEGTNLAALMLGPGQGKKDLSSQWKMKATTRAAAGFYRGKSEKINPLRNQKQSQIGDSEAKMSRRLPEARKKRTKNSVAQDINHSKTLHKKQETFREDCTSDTDENDDDDLDIPALRTTLKPFAPPNPTPTTTTRNPSLISVKPKKDSFISPLLHSNPSNNGSALGANKRAPPSADLSIFDDFLSIPTLKSRGLNGGVYKGKAMAALAKRREMEKPN